MSPADHVIVSTLFNEGVARRLAVLLQYELIPVELAEHPPVAWELWVPVAHEARAQELLASTSLSDQELNYLATGELGEHSREA